MVLSAPYAIRSLAMAAAAAGVGLWAALLLAPAPADLPPALNISPVPEHDTRAVARLFGSEGVLDTQITVFGIIAAGSQGSAILSVDGAPPQAYRIGSEVAAGFALVEISDGGVELEHNGTRLRAGAPRLGAIPDGFVMSP